MKRKIFHLFSWFNGQFLLILFNNLSVIKYFRAWNIIFFLKKIDQCQLRTNTVAFDTVPTLDHERPYSCLIKRLILHSPLFSFPFFRGGIRVWVVRSNFLPGSPHSGAISYLCLFFSLFLIYASSLSKPPGQNHYLHFLIDFDNEPWKSVMFTTDRNLVRKSDEGCFEKKQCLHACTCSSWACSTFE